MPTVERTPIPDDITAADVLAALADLKRGEVPHEFHASEKFDLVWEGERFPPKAVLGLAARRIVGAPLRPRDFTGGRDSKCFKVLQSLGFVIEAKPASEAERAQEWTEAELDAAVAAYLEMLSLELSGQPYRKSDFRQRLLAGPLAARTNSSLEYRMQNISSVLNGMGRRWIQGYRPAEHVGEGVANRIAASLARHAVVREDVAPEVDPTRLVSKAKRARAVPPVTPPSGNPHPAKATRTVDSYVRDPHVVAEVWRLAAGHCECCGNPAPFLDDDGDPFLEVHHVVPLAENGPDTVSNAVALCPNCHRRHHFGAGRAALRERLYERVGRLVRVSV